jgi:hypothetical protein
MGHNGEDLMPSIGIVFRGKIEKFKLGKIKHIQSDDFTIPFTKTLFVDGVRVPFDLLAAGWHFLDRWDIAVPLWRYGKTANDVGTKEEREITREIIRDLRVLLHSYELLFIRRNDTGLAFMHAWEQECKNGADKRLAFLRALYIVKPRVCVLPTSWLAEVNRRSAKDIKTMRGNVTVISRQQERPPKPLVTVDLGNGRMVKCHQGDEEKVRKQFERMNAGIADRRKRAGG